MMPSSRALPIRQSDGCGGSLWSKRIERDHALSCDCQRDQGGNCFVTDCNGRGDVSEIINQDRAWGRRDHPRPCGGPLKAGNRDNATCTGCMPEVRGGSGRSKAST